MTQAMAIVTQDSKKPLPDGWRWVRLGDVCEFTYGESLPSNVREKGTVPVYGSNGVVGHHNQSVTKGPAIIIGRKGSIGEVHYSLETCWPIDTTYYIENTKLNVDLAWLAYWLRALNLSALNKAAAVPGLNRDDAYAIEIPLPPLPEQKRIASILGEQRAAVEQARAATEAQSEAVETLPSAYQRSVFESLEIKRWPQKRLGEVCNLVNGDAYRETDWAAGGVPIIRIQNLNDPSKPFNYWTGPLDNKVTVDTGDVLIAWSGTPGTSFGAHRWDRGKAVLNQHIFRADLNSEHLDAEWAVFAINEQLDVLIRKAHGGVGLQHVTRREVESLIIPLPPLSEQCRLVAMLSERLNHVRQVRSAVRNQLDTITRLPSAILHWAFSGEL